MSTETCLHPKCTQHNGGKYLCWNHWRQLPAEYQQQLRQAKTVEARGQVVHEIGEYFESRMIGNHDIVKCRGKNCGADIVWLEGIRQDGSTYKICVEAETVSKDDEIFDRNRHAVHWENCPDADHFRRR